MPPVSLRRGWPGALRRRSQRGLAVVYGLFTLIIATVALFYLFNTGQVSREKTKLVDTTDAVAYSAGVMNARTLNYMAYTNRAMIANTVAISQLVSVSSWVSYANNMATYGGSVLDDPKYLHYYPSYFTALYSGPYLHSYLNESGVLEDLAKASDNIITKVLMTAQKTAYVGLIPARMMVMNEVAEANYLNDGTVIVDPIPLSTMDVPSFVTNYKDDERTRFAEVALIAAKKDAFQKKRSWKLPALWSTKCFPAIDWLDRRGGTELIGFDEWKALDTLSEKAWHRTKSGACVIGENPAAWGSQAAADDPSSSIDPTRYDYSMLVNPAATFLAETNSSDAWDYSGLPAFYDLSENAMKDEDPRLRFAVRLRRPIGQTLTSEGRSDLKNSGSGTQMSTMLNAYQANPAGGNDLVAVSTSEVFFARYGDAKENIYGKSIGKPREIGNLFNPYWHVRLTQDENAVHAAQVLQGAGIP